MPRASFSPAEVVVPEALLSDLWKFGLPEHRLGDLRLAHLPVFGDLVWQVGSFQAVGLDRADFPHRAAELCDEPGIDPYTGKRFTPDTCDVDHVVAAKEAWESGAWAWPAERRKAFGADRANLAATLDCVNRSKGDGDIAEWSGTVASGPCAGLAITPRGRCWWAAAVLVKAKWG